MDWHIHSLKATRASSVFNGPRVRENLNTLWPKMFSVLKERVLEFLKLEARKSNNGIDRSARSAVHIILGVPFARPVIPTVRR